MWPGFYVFQEVFIIVFGFTDLKDGVFTCLSYRCPWKECINKNDVSLWGCGIWSTVNFLDKEEVFYLPKDSFSCASHSLVGPDFFVKCHNFLEACHSFLRLSFSFPRLRLTFNRYGFYAKICHILFTPS